MNKNLLGSKQVDRSSGIELLRVIAIIMIVISHSIPFYGDSTATNYVNMNLSTNDLGHFILIVFKYFGQIGNTIFVIISSYYLVESKRVKSKKVISILVDSFMFSFVIMIICIAFGVDINGKTLIKQLLPITYQSLWFVGCYLLLYVVHPVLNLVINGLDKKQLFKLVFSMVFLYAILSFVLGGAYYYNYLIGFIMIYFITAYVKKYLIEFSMDIKSNILMAMISYGLLVILLIITNIAGLNISSFSGKMLRWNIFTNPLIMLLCFGLFNIFNQIIYKNRVINNIASLTLFIYMIHENPLIRDNLKPLYFNAVNGNMVIWSLILAALTLLVCIPISSVYKNIMKPIFQKIINNPLDYIVRLVYLHIEDKFMKMK